jgi:hypothetical protein
LSPPFSLFVSLKRSGKDKENVRATHTFHADQNGDPEGYPGCKFFENLLWTLATAKFVKGRILVWASCCGNHRVRTLFEKLYNKLGPQASGKVSISNPVHPDQPKLDVTETLKRLYVVTPGTQDNGTCAAYWRGDAHMSFVMSYLERFHYADYPQGGVVFEADVNEDSWVVPVDAKQMQQFIEQTPGMAEFIRHARRDELTQIGHVTGRQDEKIEDQELWQFAGGDGALWIPTSKFFKRILGIAKAK